MKLTPVMKCYAVPFLTLLIPAFGQWRENTQPKLTCEEKWRDSQSERSCEVREQRLPAMQRLEVQASPNGGVTVRGWNRQEILVRARVEATATSMADAKALAAQVQIQAGAGRLTAAGPERNNHKNAGYKNAWWSVSYEVFVPHRIDLQATSNNGGITIEDVEGDIGYSTHNGGVNLARLAGNVHGETNNGGINVEMAGNRWRGAGLEAKTVNGGVNLYLPLDYSAKIQASTNNGGLRSEFPFAQSSGNGDRHSRKDLEFTVGQGGAPIRIATHNGGVSIKKKAI